MVTASVLDRGDDSNRHGFFVTRTVHAESEKEAGTLAVTKAKSDPELALAYSATIGASPNLIVKTIHELAPECNSVNTDYTFFPMVDS